MIVSGLIVKLLEHQASAEVRLMLLNGEPILEVESRTGWTVIMPNYDE